MRKNGIEVDIQTAGALYASAFNLSDPLYTTRAQLDTQTGKTFERLKNATQSVLKKKEIKSDSPTVSVAAKIADLLAPRVGSNPTVQKQMEDRLFKWAKNQLKLRNIPLGQKTGFDAVKQALELELRQPLNAPAPVGHIGMLESAHALQNELKQVFGDLAQIAGTPYQQQGIVDAANVLASLPYSLMLSHSETQKVIKETMGKAGFTKQLNTKNGPKEVLDWHKIIKHKPDFRATIDEVFGQNGVGYSPQQVLRIQDAVAQEYEDLLKAKMTDALAQRNKQAVTPAEKTTKTATDRLYDVYNLGVFQSLQREALANVLGVNEIDAQAMKEIEDILRISKMAFDMEMSMWSPSFLRGLRRGIDRKLLKLEERTNLSLKAIRTISYLEQLNAGWIISNFQNAAQNLGSAMFEGMTTLLENPLQAKEAIEVFGNVFLDVTTGGVREGVEVSNVFEAQGSVEDVFTISSAKTTKDWMMAIASQYTRTVLSATDSAAKASLIHMKLVNTAANMLIRANTVNGQAKITQGEAAMIINELFHGNTQAIANHAKFLADTLKASGEHGNKFTKRRMAEEIALANLLAGGNVFQDAIDQLISDNKLPIGTALNGLNEKSLRALRLAANRSAARGLGHESDFAIMRATLDRMNLGVANLVTNARRAKHRTANEKLGDIRKAELGKITWAKFFRFRGGMLRWTVLTAMRSHFLPLLAEVAYRGGITGLHLINPNYFSGNGGIHELRFKNLRLDLNDEKQQEEALTRYLSMRTRLAREFVGSTMAYGIGYKLILPAMLNMFIGTLGGDKDDPEKLKAAYAALAEWIAADPARKRWFVMGLPLAVYNYAESLLVGGYGKFKADEPENIVLPGVEQFIDPMYLAKLFDVQWSQGTIPKLMDDLQKVGNKHMDEQGEGYAKIFGEQLGNFVNLGGATKMVQTNSNAIKAIKGIAAKASGESEQGTRTSKTPYQRDSSGGGWVDHAVGSMFGKDLYNQFIGNDTRPGPVSDKVIADYERTGNMSFLPPLPASDFEFTEDGTKYTFRFTPELAEEFKNMMNDAYMEMTKKYIDTKGESWDRRTDESKLKYLKEMYTEVRENVKEKWRQKYKEYGPKAKDYWKVKPSE